MSRTSTAAPSCSAADLDVINDGPDKAVQIWNVIGRRPILAAGNSNGDLAMLTFAGGPSLPALRLLVVHDDGEREFEYSAGAEKALSTTQSQGWTAVSMQDATGGKSSLDKEPRCDLVLTAPCRRCGLSVPT